MPGITERHYNVYDYAAAKKEMCLYLTEVLEEAGIL